ncbi:MAG: hypothetical protein KGZ30_04620 [Anaplasmataceae bacterium]|nr:hypothetical protein [Anaplasmataceae bacterium]
MKQENSLSGLVLLIVGSIFLISAFAIVQTVFGASSTVNVSSSVTVGNAAPTVSNVVLNGGSTIVLTPNATTAITVSFRINDPNGCEDVIVNGNTTSTVFRSGVGSACSASNLSCYIISTTTSNCSGNASTTDATTTFGIYYFADSTNGASSSYDAQDWVAHVAARDATGATSSATSTHRELNVLTAIELSTTSISYGSISAGSDTGSTNQSVTSTNAGNSSTTLRLHASSTLASGANSIATSSQRYSTSSFTYAGTSTALTDTVTTVSGFLITSPTSTASSSYSRATLWGLAVPGGTPTGTYTGSTIFTALWQQ